MVRYCTGTYVCTYMSTVELISPLALITCNVTSYASYFHFDKYFQFLLSNRVIQWSRMNTQ